MLSLSRSLHSSSKPNSRSNGVRNCALRNQNVSVARSLDIPAPEARSDHQQLVVAEYLVPGPGEGAHLVLTEPSLARSVRPGWLSIPSSAGRTTARRAALPHPRTWQVPGHGDPTFARARQRAAVAHHRLSPSAGPLHSPIRNNRGTSVPGAPTVIRPGVTMKTAGLDMSARL